MIYQILLLYIIYSPIRQQAVCTSKASQIQSFNHQNLQYFNTYLQHIMESSYCQPSDSSNNSQSIIKRSSECEPDNKWGHGLWTDEEKVRYIAYIHFNKELLNSKLLRRTSKIFKQMSKFVKTRNPSQCRSQNQKVYRRYKTTRRIVSAFKEQYGAARFDSIYKELIKEDSIIFNTESENKNISNVPSENDKLMHSIGVQTHSDHMLIEMSVGQYQEWRLFKSMRYNVAQIYQSNIYNEFTHFYL